MATWTPEEDKILNDLYETAPRETILAKLPDRIWRSIYKRSVILNLNRPKDDAWKKEDDDRLRESYSKTPWDVLVTLFPGRTKKSIAWRAINVLRLTRDYEIVQEENRKTNLARRGVEYPTQSAIVQEKVKQTVRERFGVDNVFQSEDIKKKMKETNLEKFGTEFPNQNAGVREKSRQTNQERYGVNNTFQLRDKIRAGMLNKYGIDHPQRAPEIRERTVQTNMERYGTKTPAENEEIMKKGIENSIKKYGVYHTQLPEIKEKIIKTNLKRYGFDNPAKAEEIKNKIKATTFKKFGVESLLQLKEVRDKGFEILKKQLFKSKGEIKFLEYLKIFDPNTCTQVEHFEVRCVIDFYLPQYDLWCQYDGDYWHGRIPRSLERASVREAVGFDKYQNKKIPNLIRFWESDVERAIKENTIINLIENKIREKLNSLL